MPNLNDGVLIGEEAPLPMRNFITTATFYLSITLFVALLNTNGDEGPFMASGIKIGEVDQTSAIIWARLTENENYRLDGREWEKDINKSLVSHFSGVNVCSPNPDRLLSNWETALGKKRSIGGNSIELEGSNINFVVNSQSQSEYISAFQIHTVNKSVIEKRAASRGVLINNNIHLGGVDFQLVE